MRKSLLCCVLVVCVAWTGCGSDDGESGGTGGDGPATAFSFDAETSRDAGASAGAAVALGIQLGDVVGNVLTTLGSGLSAASSNTGPKANIPGFCQAGSADATLQQSAPGNLAAGDVVTLTLEDCSGSPVSVMRSNGTIVLEMVRVSGGLPVIGGVITANATLDLSTDPDTTITGNFELRVDTPSLASANLFFGGSKSGDLITVTEGFFQAQLACFEIYQRVFFQSRAVEFFRAFGVLKQGNQIFTLNSYTETPDVIDFSFAGLDATPESGSLTLDSGDLSGGICSAFSGSPTPNDSFVTAIFTGGGCVSLDGTDTEGVPFSLTTTWDSLLEAGQPGTPSDECEGAGGTGGTGGAGQTTEGFEGCPAQGDIEVAADAYIRGNGVEGDERDKNFGSLANLLVKSASNNYFTRKTYMGFDLTNAPGSFTRALVVLTLERHVGRRPVDVYGLPAFSWAEDGITWNNAPANSDAPNGFAAGTDRLISSDPLDLEPVGIDDPAGTKYAFDITEFVRENAPGGITVMITNPTIENTDGSTFVSRESQDSCSRPFLHFE